MWVVHRTAHRAGNGRQGRAGNGRQGRAGNGRQDRAGCRQPTAAAGRPASSRGCVGDQCVGTVTKKTHVHWKQRRLGAFANSTPASELHDHPSIHPFITDCSIYVQMQALCACACTWARAHMPVHALLSKRPPAAHAWEARTTWPARRAALPLAWHAEECERVNAHSLEYVPAGRGPCG